MLLPWVETGILLFDYFTAPKKFDAGLTSPVRETRLGKAGISICFEILYPQYIRYMVASGSKFLVNISSDTWFGKSSMPRIHLNGAVLRAIETRRSVVRASNSGISAVISPAGDILQRTQLFKQEKLTGKIYPSDSDSLYVQYGDMVIWLSFIIVIGALLRSVWYNSSGS